MPVRPDYRVTVVRHGGFTGVPMTFTVDTSSLPSARAERVRRLVAACGELPPRASRPRFPAGRDMIEWSVRVEGAERRWSLRCREDALDPAVAELISAVRERP